MKKFIGAVSLSTMITIGGGLIAGIASGIIWVQNTAQQYVAPVQAEADLTQKQVNSIAADLQTQEAITKDTNEKVNQLYEYTFFRTVPNQSKISAPTKP